MFKTDNIDSLPGVLRLTQTVTKEVYAEISTEISTQGQEAYSSREFFQRQVEVHSHSLLGVSFTSSFGNWFIHYAYSPTHRMSKSITAAGLGVLDLRSDEIAKHAFTLKREMDRYKDLGKKAPIPGSGRAMVGKVRPINELYTAFQVLVPQTHLEHMQSSINFRSPWTLINFMNMSSTALVVTFVSERFGGPSLEQVKALFGESADKISDMLGEEFKHRSNRQRSIDSLIGQEITTVAYAKLLSRVQNRHQDSGLLVEAVLPGVADPLSYMLGLIKMNHSQARRYIVTALVDGGYDEVSVLSLLNK